MPRSKRLKDLSAPERLFQVDAEGLRSGFGALRTVDRALGNLPQQVTSFVGRDREIGEVCELVRAHRLVTLTGVGGVGKTRMAVEVAAELIDDFPEGVWLVELASVGDPDAVPDAVAAAIGITPQAGITVTDSIASALSGRRLLLVVDNCEHVLDAAAELIEPILLRADTVRVLATSRENLRVDAEHVWSVPSLDVRAGTASAAVQLFVDRALAVAPRLSLEDADDVAAVTEICERLDGIALAIELAAARMASLGPRTFVTGSVTDSACYRDRGVVWRGIRPFAMQCSGPTSSSTQRSGSCSTAARSSPTDSTSPPR